MARQLQASLPQDLPLISCSKGIAADTLMTPLEIWGTMVPTGSWAGAERVPIFQQSCWEENLPPLS